MDVPTSEVGYTPAMPRREVHEVHKRHVVALGEKKYSAVVDRRFAGRGVLTDRKQRRYSFWLTVWRLMTHIWVVPHL